MIPYSLEPQTLVGTWRRFGAIGPVYEVVGVGKVEGEELWMRIRLPESGEEADYKLTDLLDDPKER
jgi:hypothetical protein